MSQAPLTGIFRNTLPLSSDLPAGSYRLIAGFYNAATGERLPVDSGGDFVGLGQLPVQ